jgi:hypothetical protein
MFHYTRNLYLVIAVNAFILAQSNNSSNIKNTNHHAIPTTPTHNTPKHINAIICGIIILPPIIIDMIIADNIILFLLLIFSLNQKIQLIYNK